jgi:hypothetical protein
VNIGNAGSVQKILAAVDVEDPLYYANINVDDSADASAKTVTLSSFTPSGDTPWGQISGLAPAAISYEYADTNSVHFWTGKAADTVDILGSGVTTGVYSGGGADTINVGNAGSVKGILGELLIETLADTATLNVDASADTAAQTVTISSYTPAGDTPWDKIVGLAPAVITYEDVNVSSVSITTGQGADTVNVQSIGVTTYLSTSGGADTVNVGNAGSVQGILGTLNVENPNTNNTTLNVDDSADGTGRTFTLSSFTPSFDSDSPWGCIAGLAPKAIQYEYADVSSLSVSTGKGADTVGVWSTGVSTSIYNYGGQDTVNVGYQNKLDYINGVLVVDSVSGQTQLNVNDSADMAAHTATLKASLIPEIVGLAPVAIGYGNLSSLSITTGTAADTVNVYSTYYPTTLNSGGGQDTVNVGYNGVLSYITGALTVKNTPSYTALTIDDSAASAAQTASIESGAVTGLAPVTISYVQNDLSGLTVKGGTGGNTFTVANTPYNPGKNPVTTLNSGGGNDKVVIKATTGPLSVNGGAGNDTLVGRNATNIWKVTGSNAGTVGNVSFSAVENLTGGSGVDEFVFSDGKSVSGKIDGGGGGNDWLDYAAYTSSVTVNLATGSATGIAGGIANIRNVRGGQGGNTLTGNSQGNILIGGNGADTIVGGSGRSILIGGKGTDTINGGSGDDIVIGGYTSYDGSSDANDQALIAIMAEWQSTVDPFSTRVSKITAGVGPMLAKLVAGTTVFTDGNPNNLNGGGGSNWLFN